MNINFGKKIGDKPVNMVVRFGAEDRIGRLHFRGKTVRRAGNFFAWHNIFELFEDIDFLDAIYKDASDAYAEAHLGTSSFTYDFRYDVGWSSTDHNDKYSLYDQERFSLNRRAEAWRIRSDMNRIKAPRTSLVTVIYELRDEGDAIAIIIHSLYPGPDIGDLIGDVSVREHCVFFSWDHPGQ